MTLVETAVCAREGLLKTFSCKKALDEIRDIGTPHGYARIMTPDAWRAIFESNEYDTGLLNALTKLRTLTKNGLNPSDKESNIFDVLLSSFYKSGLSREAASEASWNTLAAISNGGANTSIRAWTINKGRKAAALSVIANAMGDLDYLKQKNGWPLFSYPTNVKTDCDSAKPYDFWMSAYMARKIAKDQGLSKEDAVKYIMLAQKSYQVNRDLVQFHPGSKTTDAIFGRNDFDPVHEVIRMDLAYTSIGAAFGVDSVTAPSTKNYDANRVIVSLIESAGSKSSLKSGELDDIDKFKSFEKLFRPDVAVSAILQQ